MMSFRILFFSVFLFPYFSATMAQNGIVMAQKDRIWTYVNLEGQPIRPGEKKWKIYPFDPKGVALVQWDGYKLINANGDWVPTEPENFHPDMGFFGAGASFSEGFLKVEIDEKWGQLNHEGKIAIQPKYDALTIVGSGHAIGKQGDRVVVIDRDGEEALIEQQDIQDFKAFQEGLAHIRGTNNLWGFINTEGKVVVEPQFISVGDFYGGLAWAKTADELVGFINPDGNWAISPQYQAVKDFDPKAGLAMVKMNDVWQYVSRDGMPRRFNSSDKPFSFSEGMAIGRTDDKVGFIDAEGNWAIPSQFEAVRDFKNGYAAAKLDGKWGLIDLEGKWVLSNEYDAIKDVVLLE